ncbi:armadillo repeat-containing protein 7 [Blastocystis sp. ATCC 50177/Nand II]|uniref:Armadillo repeat-containing protein 7 n=1 Tax=Blastocystis sp. subtype 1 (strain ATCC 50177 / NandII) TaxID=478820 RepID=A0A196S837_BLAHN|nr:armadillo repeat-containing protein 7 [Blastocystis sp. ATCC 50177/Nand II]
MQKLVTEYQDTPKIEARRQIIANLANFAYDPYNFAMIEELHILDLFLDGLEEEDEQLREFGMGGICNCACDDGFAAVILSDKSNVKHIVKQLSSTNENTVVSALTTLYYLLDGENGALYIKKPNILKAIHTYAECDNVRIRNVASCLLKKCS